MAAAPREAHTGVLAEPLELPASMLPSWLELVEPVFVRAGAATGLNVLFAVSFVAVCLTPNADGRFTGPVAAGFASPLPVLTHHCPA